MISIFGMVSGVVAQGAGGSGSSPALDFGDHSSATLAGKAWEALGQNNLKAAIGYADKCQELYMTQALEQQASLTAPAPKESAHDYWALNDVGTCLFIKAQAYEQLDEPAKALEAYKTLAEKLSFSQCWDTKGWFWSPADAARKKVVELEFTVLQNQKSEGYH